MTVAQLKRRWHDFEQLEPGSRFQKEHERHRQTAAGKSPVRRAAYVALAIACLAVGVVLVFIPGPAVVFFALAGALLATQSHAVARACDFTEVRLRRAAAAVKRWKGRHFKGLGRSAS